MPKDRQPSGALGFVVTGTPSADSDTAITRWFERWLSEQHPGTVWHVQERGEAAA
jgi:hypothetical protein